MWMDSLTECVTHNFFFTFYSNGIQLGFVVLRQKKYFFGHIIVVINGDDDNYDEVPFLWQFFIINQFNKGQFANNKLRYVQFYFQSKEVAIAP